MRPILLVGGAPRQAVDAVRYLSVRASGATALALRERLAFRIELDPALMRQRPEMSHHSFDAQPDRSPDEWPGARPGDVQAARALLPQVRCGDELLQALCATALALGVDSVRAPLLALRAVPHLFGYQPLPALRPLAGSLTQ